MGCVVVPALTLFLLWQLLQPLPSAALPSSPTAARERFILYLHDQPNFAQLPVSLSPLERRQAIVQTLQSTAQISQASLLAELNQQPSVRLIRSLWINNSVVIETSPEYAQILANHPDIRAVVPDSHNRYLTFPQQPQRLPNGCLSCAASWGVIQVRARQVWAGLGIDGAGVTVGIMDSGVDWTHPDLVGSYRGGAGDHAGNWLDIVGDNPEPIDPFGHGTHVAGTAAGQNGIGVAPGSQWIAVRVFDEQGLAYNSDIHLGFQWLLAPNGQPELAPEVVNGSWGGSGESLEFWADVALLRSAGILPVFAAGNYGSYAESLTSPAAYDNSLAVGASDMDDQLAWFSSRGPSFLTEQLKPELVAPGANIWSALPNSEYGLYSGTSMAAPHVAGTVALLLSANPNLSPSQLTQILTSTAQPMTETHPNYDSGWGRLDSYAAVASQWQGGGVAGTIFSNNQPIAHTPITLTTPSGISLPFQTDENGQFHLALQAATYQLQISLFGYAPYSQTVQVTTAILPLTIELIPLPAGTVTGVIRNAADLHPLSVEVRLNDGLLTTRSGSDGWYELRLPAGSYTLTLFQLDYEQQHLTITVVANQTLIRSPLLESRPKMLLIDSGVWYYESVIGYYEAALSDLGWSYDRLEIRDPVFDYPTIVQLFPYEVVVWSAPWDAPGLLGDGSGGLYQYLQRGGKLFISGQDVAWHDGVGIEPPLWFYELLSARFGGELSPDVTIQGMEDGLFAGMSLTLNGLDSAGNQEHPDWVVPFADGQNQTVMRYDNGEAAAISSGLCQRYNMFYLGFGLEGVSGVSQRSALLQAGLDSLALPLTAAGVVFESPPSQTFLAAGGATLTHSLQIRNQSELLTSTFTISVQSGGWTAEVISPTLELGACNAGTVPIAIHVPNPLPNHTYQTITVTVTAVDNPHISATLPIHHKTPGDLLFIDDDRWYNRQTDYQNALDSLGIAYDLWDTQWSDSPEHSPSLELLSSYDFVLWYTGYDWFNPVTPNELAILQAYLAQGGRFFLSSQDYLYYHLYDSFTSDYLGVLNYAESITPTQLLIPADGAARSQNPLPAEAELLSYAPYQNYGDGIVPAQRSTAIPYLWHNSGYPAVIASQGANWRTIFWSIPLETLPVSAHAPALNRSLAWLSDLGNSSWQVSSATGELNSHLFYTLTIRSNGWEGGQQLTMTNPLPTELALDPLSLVGGSYDSHNRTIYWQGALADGESHLIHYQATLATAPPANQPINNVAQISYRQLQPNGHALSFSLAAKTWADLPDFSDSVLTFTPASLAANRPVTVSWMITPTQAAALPLTATLFIPHNFQLITDSLQTSYARIDVEDGRLVWQGQMPANLPFTLTIALTTPYTNQSQQIPLTALIEAPPTTPQIWRVWLPIFPYRFYLPFIARE